MIKVICDGRWWDEAEQTWRDGPGPQGALACPDRRYARPHDQGRPGGGAFRPRPGALRPQPPQCSGRCASAVICCTMQASDKSPYRRPAHFGGFGSKARTGPGSPCF